MTVLFVITGLALVLVNNDLFRFVILYHCSSNSSSGNVCPNLQAFVLDCEHLIKGNALAGFNAQLFDINDIALGYFVLFTTCCNNCVDMAPPKKLLARCGGVPGKGALRPL